MGKRRLVKVGVSFFVLVLSLTGVVETANAALTLENVRTWYWTGSTDIRSVARGDVDGDGVVEIVTGGDYSGVAQLCVWSGATLALEKVKTWYWAEDTHLTSVAVGDVDGDGAVEIVTGGWYDDGTRWVAQLCVWSGATLALENVKTWYWTDSTRIESVAVGNVDGDGQMEIVTGGYYYDGTRCVAQLCVWNGAALKLENVKTWYWTSCTDILSVAVGNVDGDAGMEIITGGHVMGHGRAQLCVWSGATLALENVRTWEGWESKSTLRSVAVGDVDGDVKAEIVTGGYYYDETSYNNVAQLCVFSGATLAREDIQTWSWGLNTIIESVAIGNVDADAAVEVVTGGYYFDGYLEVAQLCVWNGATLALEDLKTWYWTSGTLILSVAVGNVDADGAVEIVTGGSYYDGTRRVAQLCVWAAQ